MVTPGVVVPIWMLAFEAANWPTSTAVGATVTVVPGLA